MQCKILHGFGKETRNDRLDPRSEVATSKHCCRMGREREHARRRAIPPPFAGQFVSELVGPFAHSGEIAFRTRPRFTNAEVCTRPTRVSQAASWQRFCIDRPQQRIIVQRSGQIHRPQLRPAKSVVKLMALGDRRRAAIVTNANRRGAETRSRLRAQDKTT